MIENNSNRPLSNFACSVLKQLAKNQKNYIARAQHTKILFVIIIDSIFHIKPILNCDQFIFVSIDH